MFSPRFSLTPGLVNNLAQIERLYGQMEVLRIPKQLELNLERKNLAKSSYISNSIEGNPLSQVEVTNLLLGDRVPANRDEKEVRNYFDLLRDLPASAKNFFSIEEVQQLHRKLLDGVNDAIAGHIRNKKVIIGTYVTIAGKPRLKVRHEPPYHSREQIRLHLEELLNWLEADQQVQPMRRAGIFHHQYVYLHPFEDGNGRTCRLLTAWLLLKYGYQINRYFVLDDYYDIDRLQYSDMLASADLGDKTQWLTYFTAGVKYSLQSALGRVNSALETMGVTNRPTGKEREVLELLKELAQLTSADVASRFGISRQQAHKLLSGLVEKGYADKKGGTKSSFYVLK